MEVVKDIIGFFSTLILFYWIGYLVATLLGKLWNIERFRMSIIREVFLALGVFGAIYTWGILGVFIGIFFLAVWVLIVAIERKEKNTYYGKVLPSEPWEEPEIEPLRLDAFKNYTGEYLFQIKQGKDDNWHLFDTKGKVVYTVESGKFNEFNKKLVKIIRELQDEEYEEV